MPKSKVFDVMAILGLSRGSSKSENVDILLDFLLMPQDLGKKFKTMKKVFVSELLNFWFLYFNVSVI